MIENNPTNVSWAFEMLLEEVEAEIDFVNGVGLKAFSKPTRPAASGRSPIRGGGW